MVYRLAPADGYVDSPRENSGAAIQQIVAVDRRDDAALAKLSDRLGYSQRFAQVKLGGPPEVTAQTGGRRANVAIS